jgi:hypothetical protein
MFKQVQSGSPQLIATIGHHYPSKIDALKQFEVDAKSVELPKEMLLGPLARHECTLAGLI